MFFSRYGSTWEYTKGKAWNTTDFPKPVGIFTKTSLLDSTTGRKAFSWCLFSLSNPKTSPTLPPYFPTRFSERSTKKKITSYFLEYARWIVIGRLHLTSRNCFSRLVFVDVIFWRERSDDRKYVCCSLAKVFVDVWLSLDNFISKFSMVSRKWVF